jgi:hypothetical protein
MLRRPPETRSKQGSSRHATFSLSPDDRERIDALRARLGREGLLLNRSEVVRLGLLALDGQPATSIASIFEHLKRLRPGRAPKAK